MATYLVCITGASGAIYGLRLLEVLASSGAELHAVVSAWGRRVIEQERGESCEAFLARLGPGKVRVHAADDLSAPVASGSFRLDGTAIVPCSMATVGALASGAVTNLVHRAGAVALKEGRPLILAPRETPLSLVDLRNLQLLAEAGAAIMPASPAFYNRPASVEELVDGFVSKVLDRLGAPNPLARPWQGTEAAPIGFRLSSGTSPKGDR